jgi:hypothetical protein
MVHAYLELHWGGFEKINKVQITTHINAPDINAHPSSAKSCAGI